MSALSSEIATENPEAKKASQMVASSVFLLNKRFQALPALQIEDETDEIPFFEARRKERERILKEVKEEVFDYCMEEMGFPFDYDPETEENPGPLQVVACALKSFAAGDSWEDIVKDAYVAGGIRCASIAGAIAEPAYAPDLAFIAQFQLHLPQSILHLINYVHSAQSPEKALSPVDKALLAIDYPMLRHRKEDEERLPSLALKLLASSMAFLPIHPGSEDEEAKQTVCRAGGLPVVVDDEFFSKRNNKDLEVQFIEEENKTYLIVYTSMAGAVNLAKDAGLYPLPFTGIMESFRVDKSISGIRVFYRENYYFVDPKDYDRIMAYREGITAYEGKEFPF